MADAVQNKDLQDVKRILEDNAAKVSLKDLEKKGFRRVKVLNAGDIDKLILNAINTVMAKKGGAGVSVADREKILQESKSEFNRLMVETKRAQQAQQSIEVKMLDLETKKQAVDEAKSKLEGEVAALRAKLNQERAAFIGEKEAFLAEKAAFDKDKQQIYTKGLEAQQGIVKSYERQVTDLQRRLDSAEAKAADPRAAAELDGARRRVAELEVKLQAAEAKAPDPQEIERVRATFEREKQQVYTKGLEAQQGLVKSYERQVTDLRNRLDAAEGRARELETSRDATASERDQMKLSLAQLEQQEAMNQHRMETMFQDLMNQMEQKRTAAPDTELLQKELAKMTTTISDKMSEQMSRKMVDDKGAVVDADTASRAAISGLFARDLDKPIESNLGQVEIKETKTKGGLAEKLAKLKNLKGGKP